MHIVTYMDFGKHKIMGDIPNCSGEASRAQILLKGEKIICQNIQEQKQKKI